MPTTKRRISENKARLFQALMTGAPDLSPNGASAKGPSVTGVAAIGPAVANWRI